jgi:hypothetical protein
MNKQHLFLLIISLLSSCVPQSSITVTNVNDVNTLGNSSCLYALPLSGFTVVVTAHHESFIPGPYCIYAAKYLGITDAMTKPYEKWMPTDVKILPYTEADPDFIFSVSRIRNARLSELIKGLCLDSLILLPGDFVRRQEFDHTLHVISDPLSFTDLSVKRNFEADKGLLISENLPDSIHTRLPVSKGKEKPAMKTTEQKAEEAANFIIKIRKRRFKLISGQYDYMPDGESLGRAVDELNQIEAEYLSLFTGLKSASTCVKAFHFIPESHKEIARIILSRFSETEGFVYSEESDAKPLYAEIRDLNKTKSLDGLTLDPEKSQQYLLYRVPDQAFISIFFGEKKLMEAVFPVYQFGSLVPTSVSRVK